MWNRTHAPNPRRSRSGGYTMTELLTVIAIIAIVCAIAIPSVFAIRNSLRFRRVNNYAESIFLAAQTNLTEMRSNGSLGPLQKDAAGVLPAGSAAIPDHAGFPTDAWAEEYVYTTSEAGNVSYNMVLPAGSIDATVRDESVIIEYNPYTGNVYAVFYSEDPAVLDAYRASGLPRESDARKDMMLGYYCGSGLGSAQLELERSMATMTYDNGEEGMVTVRIPMPELYYDRPNVFAEKLEVKLTVAGERGGSFEVLIKPSGTTNNTKVESGNAIRVSYPLDSLREYRSFANLSTGTAPQIDPDHPLQENGGEPVTDLKTENTAFYGGKDPFTDTNAKPERVLPGDNVTVTANIGFKDDVTVNIEPAIIAGVNPMFEYVYPGADGELIVSVANGRNLQNLNAIAPSLGVHVSVVNFSQDIYWNKTVDYYNEKYGVETDGVKVYNNKKEAPARALPYFVPIHSESLFGTARFIFPGEGEGDIGGILGGMIDSIVGGTNIQLSEKVPTLTDSMDLKTKAKHAVINGNGNKVYFLNIDSNRYQIPETGTKGADKNRQFYAAGNQLIDYSFTGLFGYINTPISDLSVVNPIVKGLAFHKGIIKVPVYKLNTNLWEVVFEGKLWVIDHFENRETYNNPATGALVGASGYNTLISNCNTYIDTGAAGFTQDKMHQTDFEKNTAQNWYGVSGEGAVGGLVGYAKSHRTVSGDLQEDNRFLAFHNCFAAVPVSGNMRGTADKDFGYSNGVGGLLGNSQLTNFYNCYASGNVRANYCYLETTPLGDITGGFADIAEWLGYKIEIPYDGRKGQGAGGFVGTSHGTRYTNCFATGTVKGGISSTPKENLCVGGFVGVMSMDETLAFGHDVQTDGTEVKVAQRTIFTDCYSVGLATIEGNPVENFSGANARIKFKLDQAGALITGDYYRLLAPRWVKSTKLPDYTDIYLFRDSYYLSQYYKGIQENSNNCANPITYDALTDLPGKHLSERWRESQINVIKNIPIISIFGIKVTYDDRYFEGREPEMTNLYHDQYKTQYQSGWNTEDDLTGEHSHGYELALRSGVYPFTRLAGMDYYGNWPSRPSAAGLAYYEKYAGDSQLHYYYDREETADLRSDENAVVTKDGYAVFAANESIQVAVAGGAWKDMDFTTTVTLKNGSNTYNVFPLTDEQLQQANTYCSENNTFYAELTIKDGAKTYTTYFNPNVALTQVNPVNTKNDVENTEAQKPKKLPEQIFIRSARQLAGVANMSYAWGEKCNYVQMLDVDFNKYQMPKGKTLVPANPIGNEKTPFLGSFDGSLGYVKQAKILGLDQKSSLFGTVGKTGKIVNLSIVTDKDAEKVLTIGTDKNALTAMVAADNAGQIRNVDLTLERPVTLNAKDSVGLLAAQSSGMISDCEIVAKEAVTLNAELAGVAIGRTTGTTVDKKPVPATVQKVTVTAAKPVTAAKNLGGFLGAGVDSEYLDISVSLNGLTGGKDSYVGGFACGLDGGKAEKITVTLNGTQMAGSFAGFMWAAGEKNTTVLNELTVTLESSSKVSAKNAAGLMGMGDFVNLTDAAVTLNGSFNGTEWASGVVGQLGQNGAISHVTVTGTGVSSDGKASGFAQELRGKILHSTVKLAGINGKTEAAGFAILLSGSAENDVVVGKTAIASEGQASGFAGTVQKGGKASACRVTPALSETKEAYLNNSNNNMEIKGVTAAGFAGTVEKDASVTNSNALAKLTGEASGFVGSNAGTVELCIANVTLEKGHAFTGTNTGSILDCIGWFDGSKDMTVTAEEMGSCHSAYFANLGVVETDLSPDSVWLFDNTGAMKAMKPSALSATSVDQLNKEYTRWVEGGKYPAFPYNPKLADQEYLYPMLPREFPGNWVVPPRYPYGVAYYEHYDNGTWKMRMLDLSDPTTTVEKTSLTGMAFAAEGNPFMADPKGAFNNDSKILEAGYALFCKAGSDPFAKGLLGQAVPGAPVYQGSTYELTLYALNPTEKAPAFKDEMGKTHTVDPRFAQAIDLGNAPFEIRTPEQLANMMETGSYIQTHDVTAKSLPQLKSFSGSYNGSGLKLTAKTAATWIDTLSGKLEKLNLEVQGDMDASLLGTVSGSLTDLTVKAPGAVKVPVIKTLSGTASGLTLELPGAVTASVMDSLSGKLSGAVLNIPGTAETSIFGAVTAPKSGNSLERVTITAGTLNAPVIGGSGENLTLKNVKVEAQSANTGTAVLIPSVKNSSMENCDVTITGTAALSGTAPMGVLTGTQTGGTVSGCDVSCGTVKLVGVSGQATVAGGLVGSSTGTISGGSVNANIQYQQPEKPDSKDDKGNVTTESVILGGIVGQSSGKVEGVKATDGTLPVMASGSIELLAPAVPPVDPTDPSVPSDPSAPTQASEPTDPTAAVLTEPVPSTAGRHYTVGGAVGLDQGGSFTNVSSTVAVSDAWKTVMDGTPDIPAGLGAVGKFVGHVTTGSFQDCSAKDGLVTGYQFLGQIDVTSEPIGENVFANKDLIQNPNPVKSKVNTSDFPGFAIKTGSYNKYAANLRNCIFDAQTDAKPLDYRQEILADEYYYQQTELKKFTEKEAIAAVDPLKMLNSLTYDVFNGGKTNGPVLTPYYYKDPNGVYHRVSVERTKSLLKWTFTLYAESITDPIASATNLKNTLVNSPIMDSNGEEIPFYQLNFSGEYLLVSGNDVLTVGKGKLIKTAFTSNFYPEQAFPGATYLWTATPAAKEADKFSWNNNGSYLLAKGGITGKKTEIRVTAQDGNTIKLGQVVYKLYTVAEGKNFYHTAVFTSIPDQYNQICTSTPVTPVKTASSAGLPGGA